MAAWTGGLTAVYYIQRPVGHGADLIYLPIYTRISPHLVAATSNDDDDDDGGGDSDGDKPTAGQEN